MRMGKTFIAAAAVGVSLLTGCVSFQVDDHSYQFNEATGSLGLRLLLLNAVRASKDYPLQFTKIGAYQGTGTTGATLSATLPISSPGAGSITPRVDVKDGISELTLVDLNTEEAQQALKTSLTLNSFLYFYVHSGSRSPMVPWMLMVEHVALHPRLHKLISDFVERKCTMYLREGNPEPEARSRRVAFACEALRLIKMECSNFSSHGFISPTGAIYFKNVLTSRCEYTAFIAERLHLTVIGSTLGLAPDDKPENDNGAVPGRGAGKGKGTGRGGKSERGRPSAVKKAPGNTFNIYVTDPKEKRERHKGEIVLKIHDPEFAEICRTRKEAKGLCIYKPEGQAVVATGTMQIHLRSPERMVRYLGELIAAQSYGPRRFIPDFFDAERGERYALLTVKRGRPLPGGAVVSAVAPDGETFHIPHRNYDLPKTDLSLETLSIVTEVLNAAVSKKDIPAVTSLTVKSD